jgi:hypothetical protein
LVAVVILDGERGIRLPKRLGKPAPAISVKVEC